MIGGFDSSRDEYTSLAESSSTSGLRAAIEAQFPGASFTAADTLTAAYLATVDDVFLSSVTGNSSAASPLTAAEQTALYHFVLSGGTALVFVDNDTYSAAGSTVNNSLLAPFGLHVTGTLDGFQTGTVVNSSNQVASGAAGTAASVSTNFPGWFNTLNGAMEIADLNANGQPEVAAFLPGALGPGSGRVVFFGDSNGIILDGERTSGDTTLILNSLAPAQAVSGIPEPDTFGLLGCAAACFFVLRLMRR